MSHPLKQHPLWFVQKGLCWICGEPMTKRKKAPSRDHIVPRSRGGKGLQDNVLLAHRSCNSKRNDRLVSEMFPNLSCEEPKQAALLKLSQHLNTARAA